VVTSDACAALGMEIPEFDAKTVEELQKLLPPYAPPPRNPVDFAGAYRSINEEAAVIEKFLSLDYIDGVITNIPTDWRWWTGPAALPQNSADSTDDKISEAAAHFASLPQKYHKPIVTVRWSRTYSEAVESALKKAGIPIYETSEQCARAMYALTKYGEIRRLG
jgi:acyl-CoA synthetase (NDP forming)